MRIHSGGPNELYTISIILQKGCNPCNNLTINLFTVVMTTPGVAKPSSGFNFLEIQMFTMAAIMAIHQI